MALPLKSEYNDLNGSESKQILAARMWDFMEQIPEFQARFALTRVKLRMEIVVEVWGASPPKSIHQHSYEMAATGLHTQPSNHEQFQVEHSTTEIVDSFNNPPDQIREEHSLPVTRGERQPITGYMEGVKRVLEGSEPKFQPAPRREDLPANQASPNLRKIGKRTYAGWVDQDKGAAVTGERVEALAVGGEKLATLTSQHSGGGVIGVQPDFKYRDQGKHGPISEGEIRQTVHEHVEKLVQSDQLPYVDYDEKRDE